MKHAAHIYPGFLLCMTLTFLVTLGFGAPLFETGVKQWFANLAIAAPSFGQQYMDLPYWSLVIEVTFYAWVAVLMAFRLFPRHIDIIVVVWPVIGIITHIFASIGWDSSPDTEANMDPEKLFNLYGKWPSFAYLCLAAASPALICVLLYLLK